MPIPTRSTSLREPRELRKPVSSPTIPSIPVAETAVCTMQASGIARPAAKTTTSKVPARSIVTINQPQPSPSPVEGGPVKEGLSSHGRTLLPQRSNSGRDEGQALGQIRFQPPDNRPASGGETSPKRRPQTSDEKQSTATNSPASAPTRRQSLMRPNTLKTAASSGVTSTRGNPSASTKAVPSMTAPSPRKQPANRSPTRSTPRPPSPKKIEMPPPPRPMRSASLRQPSSARQGTGALSAARGHARHRSQMVPATATKIQPDPAAAAATQRAKPPFSTYQQHYSPKKPGAKPPTPTPGSASAFDGLLVLTSWPDIAALQTELLQLSLFHSNSLQRHTIWKAESESELRKKHETVARQYQSVLGAEKQRQHDINVQALDCWLQNCRDHHGSHGFPKQVQELSQILQEVSDLAASGMNGRYTRAVEIFDNWFQDAEQIRHRRESVNIVDVPKFIDPLDRTWKEELLALNAKLELCARQLQSLDILGSGEVEQLEQSALARVAQGLNESIQLMVQEIRAMRNVEAELVRMERDVVSHLATQLTSAPRQISTPRAGLWMS
ncbi:hypothetical protein N7532_010899 [Penicillium argentinense]|uniref:Uncharacterized protein n=1 Tax=Penicillium argentinense TaxID=1131581 RepID=A0A9W9JYD3_9EURO|nr:uncharacterized protein N7532_010899 [Penicillium argentinense]KAJ5086128.1 hypothetical protein N7532_010899 [Penicillium argentinense]